MSTVELAVYDLSGGMAAQVSMGLLGKQIDGIWHTGIRVFGREYYFGGGICADPPGATPYGQAVRVESLGTTQKTQSDFVAFLSTISGDFSFATYDLLKNNCNNFSDACAIFLVNNHIPSYILDLPNEALNSPIGPMLRNILDSAQQNIRDQSAGHQLDLSHSSATNTTSTSNATSATRKSATTTIWAQPRSQARSNRPKVITKLQELTSLRGDELVPQLLEAIAELTPESAFPALDLLRLNVLDDNESAVSVAGALANLKDRFCASNAEQQRASFMMTVRCAVNVFHCVQGAKVAMSAANRDAFVRCAVAALQHPHKAVRLSGSLLCINVVGATVRQDDVQPLHFDGTTCLTSALCDLLSPDIAPLSPDVAAPVLQALAVLVDDDAEAVQLATVFAPDVQRHAPQNADKLTACAVKVVTDNIAPR